MCPQLAPPSTLDPALCWLCVQSSTETRRIILTNSSILILVSFICLELPVLPFVLGSGLFLLVTFFFALSHALGCGLVCSRVMFVQLSLIQLEKLSYRWFIESNSASQASCFRCPYYQLWMSLQKTPLQVLPAIWFLKRWGNFFFSAISYASFLYSTVFSPNNICCRRTAGEPMLLQILVPGHMQTCPGCQLFALLPADGGILFS